MNAKIKMVIRLLIVAGSGSSAVAQLLDRHLQNYESVVRDSLVAFGDLPEPASVYSREIIALNKDRIYVYEVGVTMSHGYRRLAILHKSTLYVLKGKIIESDTKLLYSILKKSTHYYKMSTFVRLVDSIDSIFKYNIHPPWKRE